MELKSVVTIYIGSFLTLLCLVVAPKLLHTMIGSVPHVSMNGVSATSDRRQAHVCINSKSLAINMHVHFLAPKLHKFLSILSGKGEALLLVCICQARLDARPAKFYVACAKLPLQSGGADLHLGTLHQDGQCDFSFTPRFSYQRMQNFQNDVHILLRQLLGRSPLLIFFATFQYAFDVQGFVYRSCCDPLPEQCARPEVSASS